MTTLTIVIALLIVGLFVLLKIRSAFAKYRAALNALLAKYTYQNLDSEWRKKVQVQTEITLFRTAGGNLAFETEREKYGFYALAMAELGIPPALPGRNLAIHPQPIRRAGQCRESNRDSKSTPSKKTRSGR